MQFHFTWKTVSKSTGQNDPASPIMDLSTLNILKKVKKIETGHKVLIFKDLTKSLCFKIHSLEYFEI